jgi:hypothetical protein
MKQMSIKHFLPFLLFLLFVQCQKHDEPQNIIREIEQQFVPDSRTGIFNITSQIKSSKLLLTGETDNDEAHAVLINRLGNAGFNIQDSIRILPETNSAPWAIVSISVANLRKNPSHDAEMVTQALMGTPLKVLKKTNDWALVQTPDKYIAWCENDIISLWSRYRHEQWQKAKRAIVTGWNEFLRDSASNHVISDLVAGCILELRAPGSENVYVSTPDGRTGKVLRKSITDFEVWKQTKAPVASGLIESAQNFMGTPYLWGGSSAKGVDCSGFIKSIYFNNGTILARDASQQANYGEEIGINGAFDFMPGDLLFFGRKARENKPERITHVGMYLGDTEFIHSSGLVKINSFDSTRHNYSRYRTIGLLQVRRIIGRPDSEGIVSVKNHTWY